MLLQKNKSLAKENGHNFVLEHSLWARNLKVKVIMIVLKQYYFIFDTSAALELHQNMF